MDGVVHRAKEGDAIRITEPSCIIVRRTGRRVELLIIARPPACDECEHHATCWSAERVPAVV